MNRISDKNHFRSFYMKQDTDKFNTREQPSYWREAYGVAGVEYQVEKSKFVRIDKCW